MGSNTDKSPAWQQELDVSESLTALKRQLSEEALNEPDGRQKLLAAARSLSHSLETPGESVQRLAYLPLQTVLLQVGINLDLFNILDRSREPVTTRALAEQTGADPALLQRILRFLAAIPAIKEVGPSLFTANKLTKTLTVPPLAAGFIHNMITVNPTWAALPAFLEKTKYQNPSDGANCPFQPGHNTPETIFEWFPKHPVNHEAFMLWMTGQREGRDRWLDFFPFPERIADGFHNDDPQAVMLVDIGGGVGHEVQAIKHYYPSLPGRFILQDTPETLKRALSVVSMETMEYDFFTEQPVTVPQKGARSYYLRNILHDWPLPQCVRILKHVAAAMTPGYSKVLLNELVIPDQGADIVGLQIDFTMMCGLGAEERSAGQWHDMLDRAGLKVTRIWTRAQEAESIIEAELK
ncbi:MAG: hypothetical protein LQ344_001670 [Seirophora lacunosa]|nr:MAG: hypothetical protein LQ344_001670 [Seirophora lacunosa]